MIDTKELRRLAQAATPGPWHATKSVETNSWAVWSDTTRLMELRPTKTVDMYQVSNTAAFIAAANPAAISELLDRLEAAEKAVTEAYQRGYATGQEEIEKDLEIERMRLAACGVAALGYFEGCAKEYQSASLADVIALRKRFEASESDVSAWKGLATQFSQEADTLRAKVAEMERQEPVGHVWRCDNGHIHGSCEQALPMGTELYALPGAKGEKK